MYVAVKGGERAIENAHRLLRMSGAATATFPNCRWPRYPNSFRSALTVS